MIEHTFGRGSWHCRTRVASNEMRGLEFAGESHTNAVADRPRRAARNESGRSSSSDRPEGRPAGASAANARRRASNAAGTSPAARARKDDGERYRQGDADPDDRPGVSLDAGGAIGRAADPHPRRAGDPAVLQLDRARHAVRLPVVRQLPAERLCADGQGSDAPGDRERDPARRGRAAGRTPGGAPGSGRAHERQLPGRSAARGKGCARAPAVVPGGAPVARNRGDFGQDLDAVLADHTADATAGGQGSVRPDGAVVPSGRPGALRAGGRDLRGEIRLPGHGGVPRPRHHARGVHVDAGPEGPRGRRRRARAAGVSAGLVLRPAPRHGMGQGARRPGRRSGDDPGRKGRQHGDGARRRVGPRLAPGAVQRQARHRRQLQAHGRVRAAARKRRRRPVGNRVAQPVRPVVGAGRRRRKRSAAHHPDRDARGDGEPPASRALRGRRSPAAVCPGDAPRAVRQRDRLSDPAARREHRAGQLPAARLQARGRQRRLEAPRGGLFGQLREDGHRQSRASPHPGQEHRARAGGPLRARDVRQRARHRLLPAAQLRVGGGDRRRLEGPLRPSRGGDPAGLRRGRGLGSPGAGVSRSVAARGRRGALPAGRPGRRGRGPGVRAPGRCGLAGDGLGGPRRHPRAGGGRASPCPG